MRLFVQTIHSDFRIEACRVFEKDDGGFKYPATYDGGSWKISESRDEIQAMPAFKTENDNLRRPSKMARAWKSKHGVGIDGLLINSLAYKFLA